jgi:tetratricopeptide (TPR) repeat protein
MNRAIKLFSFMLLSLLFTFCGNKAQDVMLAAANELFEAEKYEEAKTAYQKLLEIYPKNKLAYYNLAVIDIKSNNPDGAVANFSKAIEIDPFYGNAYLSRGKIYMSQKNYQAAEYDFKSAQIDESVFEDALNELGRLKVATGNYEEGIQLITKCIQLNDTALLYRLTRASAFFELGLYDRSLNDINHVLGRKPKNWEANLLKARNYMEKPQLDSVLYFLDRARLFSKDHPMVYSAFSDYYLMTDEPSMAIAYAEKGLQLNTNYIPLIINKARAFDGMEKFEQANTIYNEVAELADSIPEFHYYLAKNKVYLGDSTGAILSLTDAIALRKNYSEAYKFRSILKARLGDVEGAVNDQKLSEGAGYFLRKNETDAKKQDSKEPSTP